MIQSLFKEQLKPAVDRRQWCPHFMADYRKPIILWPVCGLGLDSGLVFAVQRCLEIRQEFDVSKRQRRRIGEHLKVVEFFLCGLMMSCPICSNGGRGIFGTHWHHGHTLDKGGLIGLYRNPRIRSEERRVGK